MIPTHSIITKTSSGFIRAPDLLIVSYSKEHNNSTTNLHPSIKHIYTEETNTQKPFNMGITSDFLHLNNTGIKSAQLLPTHSPLLFISPTNSPECFA